jgi:hypothetical protein
LEYLLFVGYLLLFAWLVTKVKFFTLSGLSKTQLVIFFFTKVLIAIIYGWIGIYYGGYAKMWDTWAFHTSGLYEYNLLQNDPQEYLSNLFRNGYEDGMSRFFESRNSYWNDLKGNLFVKMLSVFDIFTLGHYYINVIFYSFFSMFGPIALYRVMTDAFKGKKTIILASIIGIPSFMYWTSGIHKEGMIFTGICLALYAVYFARKQGRFTLKQAIAVVLSLLLVLILRNFVAILLAPALFTWYFAERFKKNGILIFFSFYTLFIFFFFNIRTFIPQLDFPKAVVEKQHAFMKIKRGNTRVTINALEPTASSFLENTPQAIKLTLLRPQAKDVHHLLSLISVIEMYFLYLLVLLFLLKRTPELPDRNMVCFCLFFSLTLLLAIGFSNNNIGAIVRYRTVVLPFLLLPLTLSIDWKGIRDLFTRQIKK